MTCFPFIGISFSCWTRKMCNGQWRLLVWDSRWTNIFGMLGNIIRLLKCCIMQNLLSLSGVKDKFALLLEGLGVDRLSLSCWIPWWWLSVWRYFTLTAFPSSQRLCGTLPIAWVLLYFCGWWMLSLFLHALDTDECKEKLACSCPECSCKNTWGGYDCKCKGNQLYIKGEDTCIGKARIMVTANWNGNCCIMIWFWHCPM